MSLVSIINPKNLGVIEDEINYNSINELSAIISSYDWSPSVFSNRRRNINSFSRTTLLVLDVDDGCSLDVAKRTFAPFKHIIATSRSHQKEKNGVQADRFRVVLFLSRPIDKDSDFKATWLQAEKIWPFIDKACKDSSRFYYKSPEIISIKEDGKLFDVIEYVEPVKIKQSVQASISEKGSLWKATLEFLKFGAPPGHRHNALVQAVGNMREQNYTYDEIVELVEEMSNSPTADWTQPGLNEADLKTIERMFNRETKYEFTPKEEKEEARFVKADELFEETFDYLSDKEKVKGEPTGINGLDKLLGGGFRTGELTVLMAQAKTGKNAFYHFLMYKHLTRGIPFGYASRELSPATEVIPNLLSIATGTNAWKNELTEAYKGLCRNLIGGWPLFFAPGYGHMRAEEIEAWFLSLKEIGVNHFLFDHFHYALDKEDYEATAKLIKHLKTLTKKLDIHLNLIVQPRSLREGEALSLATLRGGAAIGQALDNLFILERVKGQENISKLTLEVARHKLAKPGKIYMQYDPESTLFEEVQKELIVEQTLPPQAYSNHRSRPYKFNEN